MLTQQYQKLRFCSKGNLKRWGCQTIPVLSIFALLGISLILAASNVGTVYAKPEACTGDIPDGYMYVYQNAACSVMKIPPTPTDHGPTSSTTASSSMLIDNGVIRDTILAKYGETNYATHIVSIKANDIADYALTLSSEGMTGPSTISGTKTATGANLDNDSWGYSWSSNLDTKVENLTYQAVGASTKLTGDSVINNSVDFSRRIAFAAKFTNANPGTYTAKVILSLTLTPKQVTGGTYVDWDDMVYLSDMSPQACASVPIGTTKTLLDYRAVYYSTSSSETAGRKEYNIARLSDGNCWMLDNLALDLNSRAGIALKDYSDNLSANYPATALPNRFSTATTNVWVDTNTEQEFAMAPALINASSSGDGNGYQTNYGYYYSWCAATAGTCSSVTSAGAEASSSICPKGWHLPKGGTGTDTNDFAVVSGLSSANVAADTNYWSSLSSPSFANSVLAVNSATWIAAGYVNSSGLGNAGSEGNYWSRTSGGTNYAYRLAFSSGNLSPARGSNRSIGASIRCVAYSS